MTTPGMPGAKTSLTILVSSAGRRVELLEAFRDSARQLGIGLTVLATDVSPELSAACQRADRCYAVPRADSAEFVPAMLRLCREHHVNLVIPTIDTELLALSQASVEFADNGTAIAVSSPDFISIARDKLATAIALEKAGLPTPRTATLDTVRANPAAWNWPVMVKPRHGSAGRSISVAATAEALPMTESEPLIVQQLLVGAEYTINMFFDKSGRARCVIPHLRMQVRAGEVEKGATERRADLCALGWRIAEHFTGVRGVICFQAIVDETGPSIFEINARFGGGYPIAHEAGAQFARWLLEEAAGLPVTAHDDWRDGVVMLRYDAAAFLER
jgi:carbamoyl-phosphate synthase large subunit